MRIRRPYGAHPFPIRRRTRGSRPWLPSAAAPRLKTASPRRVHPRRPVRPLQPLVRLLVADDLVLRRVPRQRPAELLAEVRQDAARRRDVALLDVGHRLAAGLAGLQEIDPVPPQGGRDVPLQVLLGLVLRVLVLLEERRPTQRRRLRPQREELVLVHARLERALLA